MFHRHKWIVAGRQYGSSGLVFSERTSDVTLPLLECAKCGAHKVEELVGLWPIEIGD